jgi:hypothetical protein
MAADTPDKGASDVSHAPATRDKPSDWRRRCRRRLAGRCQHDRNLRDTGLRRRITGDGVGCAAEEPELSSAAMTK